MPLIFIRSRRSTSRALSHNLEILMAKTIKRPSEIDFVQEITARVANIPNCRLVRTCLIKRGPQTFKVATILQFCKPGTTDISHHELVLDAFPYRTSGGVDYSKRERLAHWGCRDDEIKQLEIFLHAYQDADCPGTHRVINTTVLPSLESILEVLGREQLNASQLLGLISALADRTSDLRQLPELGEDDNARMVAAALRVAHRSKALDRLQELIDDNAVEGEFQKLLDQNWWMLGSQYVCRIPKRHWTNRENVDLMLKTADGFFEIIELKRPSAQLFKMVDGECVIGSEVNDAMNQAAQYICCIEMDRASIFKRFGVDLHKIKAKVLIGNMGKDDQDKRRERESLRTYNSHLHGIEIISYDQLVRIADNVVSANIGESGQELPTTEEDIPF